jgi:uncharacterized Tic20 family protein
MEPAPTPAAPTQDERLMAALAHGAILLPMTGAIVPIVIWVTQKDKSRYTAFQSLQALSFHLLLILGWFLGMGCYFASLLGMMGGIPFSSSPRSGSIADLFYTLPFVVVSGVACISGLFVLYGLVGAILTLQGKNFRYLLLGDLIERRWQKQPLR